MIQRDTILGELSPKELAVLELVSKGHDNSSIAEMLNCKVSTVVQNLNEIYSKLEVNANFRGKNRRVVVAMIYRRAKHQLLDDVATN